MLPLSEFPRVPIAHRPTPLESMPNLTHLLEGPELFVKRDDCTGLATGGNKARQMEFYFGEAIEQEATAILVTGAVQSNFVRSVAAAAAKFGLRCEVQLEDRVPGMGASYGTSGNVLLDRLFGARLHYYPVGEDEGGADRALDELAARLRNEGARPYVIHLSEDYPPLGALGYVDAAEELLGQLETMGIPRATIVVASGSAATQAGLLVGLRALGHADIHVKGICVRRGQEAQFARVVRVCRNTEKLLKSDSVVPEDDISVTDSFLGPAYGLVTEETADAILVGAREEALILDPVYTGKAFAGFLDFVRRGEVGAEAAVFLHTGGIPALFAYSPEALGLGGSPTAGRVE